MSESSHESDQQNDETWKAVEAKLLTDQIATHCLENLEILKNTQKQVLEQEIQSYSDFPEKPASNEEDKVDIPEI